MEEKEVIKIYKAFIQPHFICGINVRKRHTFKIAIQGIENNI